MTPITKIIEEQLSTNRGKNLLYFHPEKLFEVNSGFVSQLKDIADTGVPEEYEHNFEYFVSQAVDKLVREVLLINQYIQITPDKLAEAENIYRNTWKQIKQRGDIEKVLMETHFPSLGRWISSLYPDELAIPMRQHKFLNNVVCEEYSAEFQLKLLDVSPNTLKAPVLDIGCGSKGSMVKFLREKDIPAWGIDRMIKEQNSYLINSDWFSFDYGIKKWGAVISNAALSNHIVYASEYDKLLFTKYITLFKKIIGSMKPGGKIILAPWPDVIEELINSDIGTWRKKSVDFGFYTGKITISE